MCAFGLLSFFRFFVVLVFCGSSFVQEGHAMRSAFAEVESKCTIDDDDRDRGLRVLIFSETVVLWLGLCVCLCHICTLVSEPSKFLPNNSVACLSHRSTTTRNLESNNVGYVTKLDSLMLDGCHLAPTMTCDVGY